MRPDIDCRDLLAGLAYCAVPSDRSTAVSRAERAWSDREDFLIALSVRSAFDLALRALELPAGSEVLLSAVTVPDMARIARSHGLVPVPIDVDAVGSIDLEALAGALSPRSRMIVVAHLYGGNAPLDDVLKIARQHGLLVVEDCAQSFRTVGEFGQPASDLAMFSFGPIKTATALGGAVVRIASPHLRRRMAELLEGDPVQNRSSFARRIIRFATMKLLSGRHAAACLRWCVQRRGYDFDTLANSMAKGFTSSDLLPQIRRRPSIPLLRLLRRRWRTYNFARIDRRVLLGSRLDGRLGLRRTASHSYWVYPVFVDDPNAVRDRLLAAGFDATRQTRMAIVPAADNSRPAVSARQSMEQAVFLPWYPELSIEAVDTMADAILGVSVEADGPLDERSDAMPLGAPAAALPT